MVSERFRRFTRRAARVHPFYAVKCNSSPEVLRTAAASGAGFEVASLGELRHAPEHRRPSRPTSCTATP